MNALADREILELLRERPDLLAVADAVASTQGSAEPPHARRRMLRLSLVPAVAVSVAVALLIVAAPWRSNGSGIDSRLFFRRALAVVGTGQVVHVVFQYSEPHEAVVDLATGAERPRVYRYEFWLDQDRKLLRGRLSTDGGAPYDYTSRGARFADPALVGFATQYRDALAQGRAWIIGETEVGGRPAERIEFTPQYATQGMEVVTVDAETFVPLTIEFTSTKDQSTMLVHILAAESLPYRPALFKSPRTGNPPLNMSDGGQMTVSEAAKVLGRPPLLLPRAPDSIQLSNVSGTSAEGQEVNTAYVVFTYGDLRVTLATDKAAVEALGFGGLANPAPPEGSIDVAGRGAFWLGLMSRSGFTVLLDAKSKEDILDTARALTASR